MHDAQFTVVASLRRTFALVPSRRWFVEVSDPASPIAGLSAWGRSPDAARREMAGRAARALAEDELLEQSDAVSIEVVTCETNVYAVALADVA